MKSDVTAGVEAVLLNSEGDPKLELFRALEAVAAFAVIECEISYSEFEALAAKAYSSARAVP